MSLWTVSLPSVGLRTVFRPWILYRIAKVFFDEFIASYESPPEAIILDIDDIDDETYGQHQLTLFNALHYKHCYMPINIYEEKSSRLVTTVLRPGKRLQGNQIVSILKRAVRRIRQGWPEVEILLRGDVYYSCPEVYELCQEQETKYAFGFTPYDPLKKEVEALVG